jgi:hypothetical protein
MKLALDRPMTWLRKRLLVLAGLACTLALMAAVPGSQSEKDVRPASKSLTRPASPAHRPAPPARVALSDESRLPLALMHRPESGDDAVNVFAAKSWYVAPPPPPPPKPRPPPPPTAPPLPFTFLGKYQESPGHLVIFLVKGDKVYTVIAGDVIDGTYRVDGIKGDVLALTYLPLNITQTLDTGGDS